MARQHPELVVGAIVQNKEGKILLIRQKKWENRYSCFVGGHVRFGEPILIALQREIREETGLTFSLDDTTWLEWKEVIRPDLYHREAHLVFLNYLVHVEDTRLRLGAEIQEAVWVSIEEGIDMVMPENHDALEKLLATL